MKGLFVDTPGGRLLAPMRRIPPMPRLLFFVTGGWNKGVC